MQAFVVTPICPHTLSVRPMVDDAESLFRLDIPPQHGSQQIVQLVIDGQLNRQLFPGDYLEIEKAPVSFKIARLPPQNFYHTLHRKLGWGGQPRYRQSK
jgi:NAD+ kinase